MQLVQMVKLKEKQQTIKKVYKPTKINDL